MEVRQCRRYTDGICCSHTVTEMSGSLWMLSAACARRKLKSVCSMQAILMRGAAPQSTHIKSVFYELANRRVQRFAGLRRGREKALLSVSHRKRNATQTLSKPAMFWFSAKNSAGLLN